MYKLIKEVKDDSGVVLIPSQIKKTIDNGFIFFNENDKSSEGNKYREWLDEGNTPEPADSE